ncbi:MAG: hypothetical protein BMS9Abin20_1166 [Acidimicrobiia bacterium]|nr:MAG: hypothetical protein BMS9Abin20_1166 [Acidimicrobiia bacterium]
MLTKCPLCGSKIVCSRTPGTIWCTSTECGAVFHDVDINGAINPSPQETTMPPFAGAEKPVTREGSPS